jgi:hypothetical protein
MKTSNITLKKTLLAATIASGMLFTGAAQAGQIVMFDPGTFGSDNAFVGSDTSTVGTNKQIDMLNMVAVNNTVADSSKGTANEIIGNTDPDSMWGIVFGGNNTFTETFTFLVTTATLNNSIVERYGRIVDSDTDKHYADNSYVTIKANLSGTVADVAGLNSAAGNTAIANKLNLTYDAGGTFDFFFHNDGTTETGGTDTALGSFKVTSGVSTNGLESDPRVSLGWFTEATDATGFTDKNGDPFDPVSDLLQQFTQEVQVVAKSGSTGTNDLMVQVVSLSASQIFIGDSQFPAVPEPSTLAVFGIGLLGLGFAARRRKSKGVTA